MLQRSLNAIGKFAGSILALAALIGAIPVLLIAWSRQRFGSSNPLHEIPWPWQWDLGAIGDALRNPLTNDVVVNLLIRTSLVVIWAAVAIVIVTTLVETIHLVRHGGLSMPHVRGIGWAQPAARFIAAGLIVLLPVMTPKGALVSAQGAPMAAPTASTMVVMDAAAPTASAAADLDRALPADAPPAAPAQRSAVTSEVSSAQQLHVVQRGESIYGIAEALSAHVPLSTSQIADAILDLNLGTTMPGGERFTNPAYIEVGWELAIPADVLPRSSRTTATTAAPIVASDPVEALDAAPTTDGAESHVQHVVIEGDTLSEIAETHLGDADQWPVIFDENRERVMDDGRTFDDPNLIVPGWDLTVPIGQGDDVDSAPTATVESTDTDTDVDADADVDADTVDDPDTADADVADIATAVDDGSNGSDDAPTIAEPDAPAADVDSTPPADLPADTGVDQPAADLPAPTTTSTISDTATPTPTEAPDAAPPIPAAPAATTPAQTSPPSTAPAATASPSTTTTTSTTVPAGQAGGADADQPQSPRAPAPIQIEHAALLAAGVLALVGVRRRQRLRSATPRARVPEPPPGIVTTERRLRSIDVGERSTRIDVAIRAAARSLVDSNAQIGALLVDQDGAIELRLTEPSELSAPWAPEGDDGQSWQLPASVPIELLSAEARQVGTPCVALVQLGVADGRDVLVDVEACGTFLVEAQPDQADEVVTAIATGLASSPYAEIAQLISVSLPTTALLDHRNAHHATSIAAAFDLAASLVGSTISNERTSFSLRSLRTGGEMWEPAVLLLSSADRDEQEPMAAEFPGGGHGVGVVATADAGSAVAAGGRVVAGNDGWTFEAYGLSLAIEPVGLSRADLDAVADLLDDAVEPLTDVGDLPIRTDVVDGAATDTAAGDGEPLTDHPHDSDDAAPVEPFVVQDHSIVVRLMGGVDVIDGDGVTGQFERSKTVELIAWLATHREKSTRTAARTAMWDLDVRDATFANVVSEARRSLGRLVTPDDGEEWLARTLTEQLPLHPAVVTDADLIEARLDAARLQPPAHAIDTLTPAAEMIRDMPFAGTSYLWPDAEGITSNLVLLATGVATELAGHALSLGDTDLVFWATGQGLTVLPGHEELIGLRMRAHARAGDLAGIRQEWESYERVIVADAWSDGEPAPKLLALRRELLTTPA